MRTIGVAVTGVLGFLGAAGSTSSNDEARVAAYGAIIVAVVTATGTVVGQIISARNNRKPDGPSRNEELLELVALTLLDSHTDDQDVKSDAEELARHLREHMRKQRRERHEAAAAEGDGAVAAPRPPRRRRRPGSSSPEDGVGDGQVDS